jgi:hypothetical protein
MSEPTRIISVEQDDDYGIIVTFSNDTTAAYIAEELLELRTRARTCQSDF